MKGMTFSIYQLFWTQRFAGGLVLLSKELMNLENMVTEWKKSHTL